jgi:2-octaprenyl-6-methoxyphenol hydroxylase
MGGPAKTDEFDVVIAGGGLVGGSLAIALAQIQAHTHAQKDCRIALVEAVPPESAAQPSFDDRTIALSRGSYRILEQLGTWSRIADSVWPIQQIHVSQQRRFGTSVIDSDEQGVAELGYVIKSRALGESLWAQIRELPGVETFCPASVTATELESGKRRVELQGADGVQTLTTKLLIVADGARSKLRTALGISADDRDYEQVAVVAKLQIDPRHAGHIAYERFTREGPLAILPGPDGHYTVVLARNAESVQTVMDMADDELLALLQTLFGFRLGRLRHLGERQAYPLHLVTAAEITAERAVVIGNAANGLHPVAAQGFNLGLRDVASLAEIIADGFNDGFKNGNDFDAGSNETLQAYTDWRQGDQRRVVRFTDGLIRLFGVPGDAAATARGLSLAAFDILPGAKQEMARQTMGLAGKMSRLARGLPL